MEEKILKEIRETNKILRNLVNFIALNIQITKEISIEIKKIVIQGGK